MVNYSLNEFILKKLKFLVYKLLLLILVVPVLYTLEKIKDIIRFFLKTLYKQLNAILTTNPR